MRIKDAGDGDSEPKQVKLTFFFRQQNLSDFKRFAQIANARFWRINVVASQGPNGPLTLSPSAVSRTDLFVLDTGSVCEMRFLRDTSL